MGIRFDGDPTLLRKFAKKLKLCKKNCELLNMRYARINANIAKIVPQEGQSIPVTAMDAQRLYEEELARIMAEMKRTLDAENQAQLEKARQEEIRLNMQRELLNP